MSFQFVRRREEVPGDLLVVGQPDGQPRPALGVHQLLLELQEALPDLGGVGRVLRVPRDQLLRQQVRALLQAGDHRLGRLVLGTQVAVPLLE